MAKSTLAALFARDALPRRPGQLTAIVKVLAAELAAPAESAAPTGPTGPTRPTRPTRPTGPAA
jgi:hypothetical protein